MSRQYDEFLIEHKANVRKSYEWIKDNIPELLIDIPGVDYEHQICFAHDESKSDPEEYEAYDKYFYGGNRSFAVVEDFNYAWVRHIHKNPHHWQHWILLNDDPAEGERILDIPYQYIIEMICDWWSFSWSKGDLREIFTWWEEHERWMKLSDSTRMHVVYILGKIAVKLDQLESAGVPENKESED